jgi:4-hydroxy-tetrahydrodipicolinate synthase
MKLTGLIPPIITPLTAEREVDGHALREVIEFQLDAGAQGIFVLGSSGEAIYLDDDERHLVARTARDAIGGRVPLLVGALAPTVRRVVQQFGVVGASRPDAFVVTGPFYAQASHAELAAHFRIAAAESDRPVVAYDIPGNVGYALPAEVTAPLLADGTLAGLKDSSGDTEKFARLAAELGADRDAALLSGADTTALAALAAGAEGFVPGLANVRPDLFVALLDAHRAGDDARAAALQRAIASLNGLFRIGMQHGLGRHASEIGGMKHVLAARGVIRHTASPVPLEPYPAAAAEAASALLTEIDRQLDADLAAASTTEGIRS